MTDMSQGQAELDIEAALAALAHEVEQSSPRPGPDLVARVLADAASAVPVAAGVAIAGKVAQGVSAPSMWETLFGWTSGAVAAMALSLALGIGIGMELDPGDLPMTEADLVEEYVAAAGNLLQDDFL